MRTAAIFVFALTLRLALIGRFPIIFGGDPMVRMIQRDRVLISHQLPLLQLIVYSIARITHNYLITMIVMAMVGSLVGVAFHRLLQDFMAKPAAFLAALLIATNPFLTGDSIVPFQESLMLALLLFAFHFLYADEMWAASLCLGLACLTRFEA